MGFILGQHTDAADTGVNAVGQREINDAELATKRHRGFGPPGGQVLESGPSTTSHDQGQGVAGQGTYISGGILFCHALIRSVYKLCIIMLYVCVD